MRITTPLLAAALAAASLSGAASAAGPPLPKAVNGHAVHVLGRGVPTPTSITFGAGKVFVGGFGSEEKPSILGGIFTVGGGKTRQITKGHVFGLVWHKGKLYAAEGPTLVVYSGFTGKSFKHRKVIWGPSRKAPSFNGLAFGPDGRLYAGVSFSGDKYDHARDPAKYAQSVVSLRPNGKDIRIVARGLRQPFQLAFVKGWRYPFVTNLERETNPTPPDLIAIARPGSDFGFARCQWQKPSTCFGFRRPFYLLPQHASPMGIGAIGRQLYVALFGGLKQGHPVVVTMRAATGARARPFITGFVAPIVGLNVHRGSVYVGDLTGAVYRVKA